MKKLLLSLTLFAALPTLAMESNKGINNNNYVSQIEHPAAKPIEGFAPFDESMIILPNEVILAILAQAIKSGTVKEIFSLLQISKFFNQITTELTGIDTEKAKKIKSHIDKENRPISFPRTIDAILSCNYEHRRMTPLNADCLAQAFINVLNLYNSPKYASLFICFVVKLCNIELLKKLIATDKKLVVRVSEKTNLLSWFLSRDTMFKGIPIDETCTCAQLLIEAGAIVSPELISPAKTQNGDPKVIALLEDAFNKQNKSK